MSTSKPLSRSAVILFAHGARDPDWARSLGAIRDEILKHEPQAQVELAFLEFISPTLPEAIDLVAAAGALEVCVIPMFMAQSGHTKRDLPVLLDVASARHPTLTIRVATPIGEAPPVVAAIAAYALSCAAP